MTATARDPQGAAAPRGDDGVEARAREIVREWVQSCEPECIEITKDRPCGHWVPDAIDLANLRLSIAVALRAAPTLEHSRLEGNAIGQPTSVVTHDSEGRDMSEHTPGPWTVHFGTGKICDVAATRHVASMAPTCVTAQWEADAYLIAAAPDLLAALEKIQAISRGDRADDYESDAEAAADIDAIARAAIARAHATPPDVGRAP